jgi:predicted nucleotidyltransferase
MVTDMNDKFHEAFPVPVEFKDGADMSRATFDELGKTIKLVKPQGKAWLGMNVDNFIGVHIHIVDSVPFGVVEECHCKEKVKEEQ